LAEHIIEFTRMGHDDDGAGFIAAERDDIARLRKTRSA